MPGQPAKQQPILCVHGALCAAACFKTLLPLYASVGYPTYAISLRGHRGSWQPSTFAFHVLTSIDSYVDNIMSAIEYLSFEHQDLAPILIGHSMGGGLLQRTLAVWETTATTKPHPAGLVLLASAPLSGGGMDVARRWQAAEAALAAAQQPALRAPVRAAPQGWIPWLGSFFTFNVNTGVDTPAQVRNKFFSSEASEDTVNGWLRDSKGRLESIRVSIGHFWPFGDASTILDAIDGNIRPHGRKVLCISAEHDALVGKEAIDGTFDAYHAACQGEQEILRMELAGSAHHIMLDIAHQRCAEVIIRWIEEKDISAVEDARCVI